jgi:hypothetical protein
MRYSNQAPISFQTPVSPAADNREFFAAVRRGVGDEALSCSVLLLGGRDDRALALRRAQAVLRYDRLTSYWSHAALILEANGEGARGVEVSLDPGDQNLQRAGRNGATLFTLERYADSARYPNIAVFSFEFPRKSPARATIREAALDPNRERMRYPFWDQLATWARYSYAPDVAPNPLLEGVAVPGAAYCEYAFGTANIDLTPGATGNHACPEVFWATMKRWSSALDAMQSIKVQGFTLVRDETGTPAPSPPSLAEELGGQKPASPSRSRGARVTKPSRRR